MKSGKLFRRLFAVVALAPVLSSCFEEVNMQGVDLAGKWEHTLSHCSFMDDDEWQDFSAFRLIYQLKKDGTLAYGFPDSGSEFIAFGTWEKVDDSHFRLIEKNFGSMSTTTYRFVERKGSNAIIVQPTESATLGVPGCLELWEKR